MPDSSPYEGLYKEIALADLASMHRADAQFRKMRQAEDNKKAMSDYHIEAAATRAKTERLKALRLAKEAADVAAALAAPKPTKKKPAKKKKE